MVRNVKKQPFFLLSFSLTVSLFDINLLFLEYVDRYSCPSYEKLHPYWILKKVTTFQKSVSTKVVPIDLRNSNPVSVALPQKIYTNI